MCPHAIKIALDHDHGLAAQGQRPLQIEQFQPSWTKVVIDQMARAALTTGHVFRSMNNPQQLREDVLLPQNVMEAVLKPCSNTAGTLACPIWLPTTSAAPLPNSRTRDGPTSNRFSSA
jgi:hypothetical protein